MAKTRSEGPKNKKRPAITPEARESQMISYAIDLAEKQLIEGTASSQVITHFLKLGSMRHRVELEKLKLEKDLVRAKTESLQANKRTEEAMAEALAAMKRYSGFGGESDDEEF